MNSLSKLHLAVSKNIILLGLLFPVFFVLLPVSPINMPYTGRDSGVFLFIASRILKGEIPYLDVWDHKPPIIYYIDALGLGIANGSRWGVWLIEVLLLFLAFLFCYNTINGVFGKLPAFAGISLITLEIVHLINGGNLPTEFALPIQFFCFYLIFISQEKNKSNYIFLIIGILTAVLFFLKQNTIGIGLAIVLYLILQAIITKAYRKVIVTLIYFGIGSFSITLIVIGYFYIENGLASLWDATFLFNFAYSSASGRLSHLTAIIDGLDNLTKTGMAQLGILGWCTYLVILMNSKIKIERRIQPILLVGFLNFPLELLLTGVSGQTYSNYYLTLLPVFTVFSSFTIYLIIIGISKYLVSETKKPYSIGMILVLFIFFAQIPTYYQYWKKIIYYQSKNNGNVVDYVITHSEPNDCILVWGAETFVNYFSDRCAPTKFVYQTPLFMANYVSIGMIEEFLDDIVNNQPELIIDSTGSGIYSNNFGFTSNKIETSFAYIKQNYSLIDTIDNWEIYKFVKK